MEDKRLTKIDDRLARLEKAVFVAKSDQKRKTPTKDFAGLKGGLHFLISRGFFKAKKALGVTRKELEMNDYHYSAAAIQTTMNRLSTRNGPLAAFKEGGQKVYVNRK